MHPGRDRGQVARGRLWTGEAVDDQRQRAQRQQRLQGQAPVTVPTQLFPYARSGAGAVQIKGEPLRLLCVCRHRELP